MSGFFEKIQTFPREALPLDFRDQNQNGRLIHHSTPLGWSKTNVRPDLAPRHDSLRFSLNCGLPLCRLFGRGAVWRWIGVCGGGGDRLGRCLLHQVSLARRSVRRAHAAERAAVVRVARGGGLAGFAIIN